MKFRTTEWMLRGNVRTVLRGYLPEYEKVSISHKNCRQQRRSGRSRACLVAAVFAYRRVLVELPGK